jgi:hypothetical protein
VLFCSATSSSVRNSLPANSAGRSNGVMLAYDHMPCKSGSPHGVLNSVLVAAVVVEVLAPWPATEVEASKMTTPTIANCAMNVTLFRWLI